MYKIQKIAVWVLISMFTLPSICLAQDSGEEATQPVTFEALITSEDAVEVEKNLIFDASKSTHPDSEKELVYLWDFGDGNKKEGIEVVHTYSTLGPKQVKLTVSDGNSSVTTDKEVFAYRKIIMLITDKMDVASRLDGVNNYARDKDVNILVIESFDSETEFISAQVLERKISEQINRLIKIDEIIIWTDGNAGINALAQIKQKELDLDAPLTFDKKTILDIADGDISAGQVQRQYSLLKPDSIIVGKEAALYLFIDSLDSEDFTYQLEKNGYEYEIIDESTGKLHFWNFMSYFVNYLINSGIPANTVILILLLPVIATLIAFMKQVIGVTTFGVYTPSIITLSFWILGLKVGIVTILVIFGVGTLVRYALKRFRLLYVPKMAIVLTIIALAILTMLIISIKLNLLDAEYLSISIFPMLILGTLTEKFINVQSGKGFKKAIILTLETVFVAVIAYIVIGGEIDLLLFKYKFTFVQSFIFSYPETIFLFIIINIFLGRWTGLRLLEYIRFREVLRHVEEE